MNCLCIGGSWDGKTMNVPDEDAWTMRPVKTSETQHYRFMILNDGTNDYYLLLSMHLQDEQLLPMLIAHYKPK